MNSNYCEDLTDYFNCSFNRQEPWEWLREELRTAALDHFDHLIVEGFLTERARLCTKNQIITVERDAEKNITVFSGWASTKEKAKRIVSPFSEDIVEKDNKLLAKQLEKQRREEAAQEAQEKCALLGVD